MAFEIYLKKEIGNQIGELFTELPKKITVTTLTISDGLLKKGNYQIPIEHILVIKEV